MALALAPVQQKPDLACLGVISKVGDAKLSKKGVYSVLPIEVKGLNGGINSPFFYLYRPEWFAPEFNPTTDIVDVTVEVDGEEVTTTAAKIYSMYQRHAAGKSRPSTLQAICGGKPGSFENLVTTFDSLPAAPDQEGVAQILREHLTGLEVGYELQQRTDESGDPMEQYNINRFFAATDDGIDGIVRSKNAKGRKKPLVITWDE